VRGPSCCKPALLHVGLGAGDLYVDGARFWWGSDVSATCDGMPEGALAELTPPIVVIEESSQYLHSVSGSPASNASMSSVSRRCDVQSASLPASRTFATLMMEDFLLGRGD
jgi:hypothetical protein